MLAKADTKEIRTISRESGDTMNDPAHLAETQLGASGQPASVTSEAAFQSVDSKPWAKAEWNSLITSISQHNVVPVIGPELLTKR